MGAPYYSRHGVTVHAGDCLDVLATMPDASIDAVVCDPPYGLGDHKPAAIITALTAWANDERDVVPTGKGFMGRDWDAFVPPPAVWDECLRVLRPGGHLVAFAGSRTADLMGLSIRMAGFEIRDGLQWLYGAGMPKGINVSKAIDKAAGAERAVVGPSRHHSPGRTVEWGNGTTYGVQQAQGKWETAAATPEAQQWEGWNTSLKPAHEPIVLARKPLGGTVAATVLAHGTGALNIDGTRVGTDGGGTSCSNRDDDGRCRGHRNAGRSTSGETFHGPDTSGGRWPSNVLLGHDAGCGDVCVSGCVVVELDAQSGTRPAGSPVRGTEPSHSGGEGIYSEIGRVPFTGHGDSGGASRFFPTFRWEAKAPTEERPQVGGVAHPTVKPVAIMRWLVRLLTPPGGVVLDPFAGSGTTLQAARAEGFRAIGIEREPAYLPLIRARLDARPRQATVPDVAVPDDEPMDLFDFLGDAS